VPAPKTLAADVPEGCVVRNLAVEGMCCTGCTGKLYARLKTMPGLVAAAVDFEGGLAQAIVPASSDPHALEAVLTFDKYTAKLRP
jgi:copper chaperone CopZ